MAAHFEAVRATAFATIVLLAVVAAALLLAARVEERNSAALAGMLRDAHVRESVQYKDRLYRVYDGEVADENGHPPAKPLPILGIAYAKSSARRAPVLGLPGTNPAGLMSAADSLESAVSLISLQQEDERDRERVRSLHPVGFLRAISRAEDARRDFLAYGTRDAMLAYHRAVDEALRAYTDDIGAFRAAFASALPEEAKRYATGGVVVSRDAVLSATRILEESARTARRDLIRIRLCAGGMVRACSPTDISPPLPQASGSAAASRTVPAVVDTVRRIFADAYEQPAVATGRLFALNPRTCAPGKPALFSWKSATHDGTTYQVPLYVGDIRFTNADDATLDYIDYYTSRGSSYVLSSPFDFYQCPFIGEVSGALHFMKDISDFAADERTRNALASEDRSAEELLAAVFGEVLTEEAAEQLIERMYAMAMSGNLPAEIEPKVAELALEHARKTAGLEHLVREVARMQYVNAELYRAGVPVGLDAAFLFLVRNAFPALFLPGALGVPETSLYPPYYVRPTSQPYTWYSEMTLTEDVDREIREDIRFFYKLHADPSRADDADRAILRQ